MVGVKVSIGEQRELILALFPDNHSRCSYLSADVREETLLRTGSESVLVHRSLLHMCAHRKALNWQTYSFFLSFPFCMVDAGHLSLHSARDFLSTVSIHLKANGSLNSFYLTRMQ